MTFRSILGWFDAHPSGYWWFICAVVAAAFWLLARTVSRTDHFDGSGSDFRWGWMIALMLAVGRWPTWLITRQLNEDESHLLAGFNTLKHDLMFWRSVDGLTSGPLDFYALFATAWLPSQNNFLAPRLTAAALLLLTLLFTHATVAALYGRCVARIATFGAVCVEAFSLHEDFLHYSTELLPMALLSVALWFGIRRTVFGGSLWLNVWGGVLLGSVPFAKLQAAPIALGMGAAWLAYEAFGSPIGKANRRVPITVLILSALVPLAFASVAVIGTGVGTDARISYLYANVQYIRDSDESIRLTVARLFRRALIPAALLGAWMSGILFFVFTTLALRREGSAFPQKTFLGLSVAVLLVSAVCVVTPQRPYLHYCQLLVVPSTLALGATLGLIVQALARPHARRLAFGAVITCTVLPLLAVRATTLPPYAGFLIAYQNAPRSALAIELMWYARPGEALGVWGWRNSCYGETGLRQATREACSTGQLDPGPLRPYFRERYMKDLRHSAPSVFVDATGAGGFTYDAAEFNHEQQFPELADYIAGNYSLVSQPEGMRLYVRNDRLADMQRNLRSP